MLHALREALDALSAQTRRRYRLTIAAADGEAAAGLALPRIVPLVDAIHLMTYDFYGAGSARTGHHAGLYRPAGASRPATRALIGGNATPAATIGACAPPPCCSPACSRPAPAEARRCGPRPDGSMR